MSVVRIPPTLREATAGEKQVVAEGTTVHDLIADLTARFPSLGSQILEGEELAPFVNVYVDGEDVRTRGGMETPVDEGSTVILLPAMAGGNADENAAHFPRVELVPSLRSGGVDSSQIVR